MEKKPNIKESDVEFLKNIPWELSGRQSKLCSNKYRIDEDTKNNTISNIKKSRDFNA